jgi:hypothetical protein
MQAKAVALNPRRRRRTLKTNCFIALGAIEISGRLVVSPIARNSIKKKTDTLLK